MSVSVDPSRWLDRAACRGPVGKIFFPPPVPEPRAARLIREAQAKAVCQSCPVCRECLDYALAIREPHGIWGGLSESERRNLLEVNC